MHEMKSLYTLWELTIILSLLIIVSKEKSDSCLSSNSIDYEEALGKEILFFEGQRSGMLPSKQRVKWRGNSALTDGKLDNVDFLSSSWFLSADVVKTLFVETPFTFMTGEDLHLSYQLQKYRNAGSYVLPVDPNDKETWGDIEHRLAYLSETTVIFKNIIQVRDDQWWRALSSDYVTQWAEMYPQKVDALFYAHSITEVQALAPLLEKFRSVVSRKAYIVLSSGMYCNCEEVIAALKWPLSSCTDRRFKIFDLGIGAISGFSNSEVPIVQAVYASMKGLKIPGVKLAGGYYDAGDNVKFCLPMSFSIALLSWAASEYKSQLSDVNQLSHLHSAIQWGTDFLLKAHISSTLLYTQLFEFTNKYRGSYQSSCPFYCSYSGYQFELIWAATWLYKAYSISSVREQSSMEQLCN